MTGKDLAEVLSKYNELSEGEGFVIRLSFGSRLDAANSGRPIETLRDVASSAIRGRMQRAYSLAATLVGICLESGVVHIGPQNERSVRTRQILTIGEETALNALKEELQFAHCTSIKL